MDLLIIKVKDAKNDIRLSLNIILSIKHLCWKKIIIIINPSHRIVCLPAFDATNSFDSLCWYFLYLIVRLHQNLVIFAECYQEHDGGDVFKAVDPLPSF